MFKGYGALCLGHVLPTCNGSVCHSVKQRVHVTMETTILISKRSSVNIGSWTINFRKKKEICKIVIVNMNWVFDNCLSTG